MFIDQKEPPTPRRDQNKVHNHIYSFYNELFSAEDLNSSLPDLESITEGIETEKITAEENTRLQQPINKAEIAEFIKTMSNDKAPGLTGITPAFYKVFWLQTGDLVTTAVNNCVNDHSFPPKQKIGLVTLIQKQDKYTRHIGNFRPITLLSPFYKIGSGVLTNRLKPVFDKLIKPWKRDYFPDRYIGKISRNTYDIFHHAKHNTFPGLTLKIDFTKAFDIISFEFIENTLKWFNLDPKFIHLINSLLKNFQSSILINGFPTPRIQVGRGCRQGDSLAEPLFII